MEVLRDFSGIVDGLFEDCFLDRCGIYVEHLRDCCGTFSEFVVLCVCVCCFVGEARDREKAVSTIDWNKFASNSTAALLQ